MQCQTRDTSTGKEPPTVVDVYVSTTSTELTWITHRWWDICLYSGEKVGWKKRDAVIG